MAFLIKINVDAVFKDGRSAVGYGGQELCRQASVSSFKDCQL